MISTIIIIIATFSIACALWCIVEILYSSWELYKVLKLNRNDFDKYIKYLKRAIRFVDDIDWGLWKDYILYFYEDKNPEVITTDVRVNTIARPYIIDLRKNNLSCLIDKYAKDAIKLCQYNESEGRFYVYPFDQITDTFTIKQVIIEAVGLRLSMNEGKFSFYMDEGYPHYKDFMRHITNHYRVETIDNIHTVTRYK